MTNLLYEAYRHLSECPKVYFVALRFNNVFVKYCCAYLDKNVLKEQNDLLKVFETLYSCRLHSL